MILPVCFSLPRRHNRITTGRIHLSGAAARNHANVGVSADYRDARNPGRVEGQNLFLVLEQHNAFFFDSLRDIQSAEHIDDTFLHGMVHDAGHELCIENPARVVIDFSHRHLAVFYGLQ